MFDHLSITASDLDRAQTFYDAILAPLGVPRVSTARTAATPISTNIEKKPHEIQRPAYVRFSIAHTPVGVQSCVG